MNITEYISSGILESYTLGDLSEKEKGEVDYNLSLYPELKKELLQIEEVQEKLLMQAAIQPRAAVKEKLFEKIKVIESKESRLTISSDKTITLWRYAAAASIALAVMSSYLAYNFYNKWTEASSSLTSLIAQNQQIAQNYNQVNQELNKLEQDIQIMDSPKFKKVVMNGTPNAPSSLAAVYWSPFSKEVYLKIDDLQDLSHDNQYQLWAIIDGKPVDAGVFDGGFDGLLKMKNIDRAVTTFAVTIEPRGGKATPTLETMQVSGNVKG